MSRRSVVQKRPIPADSVYNSRLVTMMVRRVMKKGKKSHHMVIIMLLVVVQKICSQPDCV